MGGSTTLTMVSTTTKFYEENPTVYRVLLMRLRAQEMIKSDPEGAVMLVASMGGKSPEQ